MQNRLAEQRAGKIGLHPRVEGDRRSSSKTIFGGKVAGLSLEGGLIEGNITSQSRRAGKEEHSWEKDYRIGEKSERGPNKPVAAWKELLDVFAIKRDRDHGICEEARENRVRREVDIRWGKRSEHGFILVVTREGVHFVMRESRKALQGQKKVHGGKRWILWKCSRQSAVFKKREKVGLEGKRGSCSRTDDSAVLKVGRWSFAG